MMKEQYKNMRQKGRTLNTYDRTFNRLHDNETP